MTTDQTCVVAIRTQSGQIVKAFDVCIRGEEVYTNYSDCSTPEAHASYHKSGQYHIKKGKKYIEWTGGLTGQMEPMKIFKLPPEKVRGRSQCWSVGWDVSHLDVVLPRLTGTPDMIVDAQDIESAILAFNAFIVGPEAKKQSSIVGYPVIASHRFGSPVEVEICAFVVR
jgi:hypothetical protein